MPREVNDLDTSTSAVFGAVSPLHSSDLLECVIFPAGKNNISLEDSISINEFKVMKT